MSDYLYFDHAAATTVRPAAWEAVEKLKGSNLGNPSSVHAPGRKARHAIDEARLSLAKNLMVLPEEVIFTSGATEAMQTGIIGAYLGKLEKRPARRGGGVVYTSPLVHACVWAALDFLQTHHDVKIKYLPITESGTLDLEAIGESLMAEADLIILEHLNSEIGILQPAAKLGKKLLRYAEETQKGKPIFVVDAAASAVSELVGLEFQKCDISVISGEKFGGLSGSGVLLKSKSLNLTPLLGGSQEWGWRGGTENLVGIVALSAAYQAHKSALDIKNKQLTQFFVQIKECLAALKVKIITPEKGSGRHILHFLLPSNEEASLFVAQADLAGIALSAGSACSSGAVEGSKVLKALGLSEAETRRGVRISWGWDTTQGEVDKFCEKLKSLLE